MNTNFTNSNFGRVLYVAIITLIVAATIFVIWYMTAGYKLGTYDPDTRLGSVYIGGLTEEEVPERLDTKINTWYNDPTIVFQLKYQGYTYTFNRNDFFFNVETSVSLIKQGEINEIQVYYQGSDLDKVEDEIKDLDFLDNVIDNFDLQHLISDILHDASLMKSFSIKNVEDYLIDPSASLETLKTTDLIIPDGFDVSALETKILEKYPDGNIMIPAEELFDVIDSFGDTMNDSEMTVLSSAMLDLILETNFILNEVHPIPTIEFEKYTIDNYPYFGRNAFIFEVTDESFSFYNPNASAYMFSLDSDARTMSLTGLPFEYEINVTVNKTILDFVFEEDTNVANHTEGHEGAMIEIEREIVKIYNDQGKHFAGITISEKTIVSEFYPPEKRINSFE